MMKSIAMIVAAVYALQWIRVCVAQNCLTIANLRYPADNSGSSYVSYLNGDWHVDGTFNGEPAYKLTLYLYLIDGAANSLWSDSKVWVIGEYKGQLADDRAHCIVDSKNTYLSSCDGKWNMGANGLNKINNAMTVRHVQCQQTTGTGATTDCLAIDSDMHTLDYTGEWQQDGIYNGEPAYSINYYLYSPPAPQPVQTVWLFGTSKVAIDMSNLQLALQRGYCMNYPLLECGGKWMIGGEAGFVDTTTIEECATTAPTSNPTESPTESPTQSPTSDPTKSPTGSPIATTNPTKAPTVVATVTPTSELTVREPATETASEFDAFFRGFLYGGFLHDHDFEFGVNSLRNQPFVDGTVASASPWAYHHCDHAKLAEWQHVLWHQQLSPSQAQAVKEIEQRLCQMDDHKWFNAYHSMMTNEEAYADTYDEFKAFIAALSQQRVKDTNDFELV